MKEEEEKEEGGGGEEEESDLELKKVQRHTLDSDFTSSFKYVFLANILILEFH